MRKNARIPLEIAEILLPVRENAQNPHEMSEKLSSVRKNARIPHGEGKRWCINYFLVGILIFIPGLMLEEMLLIFMMSFAVTPG